MHLLYPLVALLAWIGQARAASLPNYIVEAYFVVEASVVQLYQYELTSGTSTERYEAAKAKIETDIDYLMGEINEIFGTLSNYGLNIEIRSRKVQFLDSSLLGSGSTNVEFGLSKFDQWLALQGNALAQDLSVLFTASELTSASSGEAPTGFAHIDGVCTATRSSAIVEFDGTYHTASVTAHEIAHILGANHDSGSGGYVMSSTISPSSARRWSFSSTTANAISVALSGTSCLGQTNAASVALTGPASDDMLNPDVVCARTLESTASFMCKDRYFYDNQIPAGDAICGAIYCKDPSRAGYCLTAYPTDGWPCGKNQVCNNGKCVADSSGLTANIDPTCVFGDQKVVEFDMGRSGVFEGSCQDFLQTYGYEYCQQNAVSDKCCRACNPEADTTGTGTDTGSTGTDTGSTGTDTGSTGTDTGSTGTDTGSTGTGDSGIFGSSDIRPSADCVDSSILCSFSGICSWYADQCCATCSGINTYSNRLKRSADNNSHGIGNGRHRPVKLGHEIMVQVKELTNKKEEVVEKPVDDE